MQIANANYKDIDGYALVHGVPRIRELPADRFVSFVWYWATRNADAEEREKFERRLWLPPKGQKGQGVWSADNETSSLSALSKALSA